MTRCLGCTWLEVRTAGGTTPGRIRCLACAAANQAEVRHLTSLHTPPTGPFPAPPPPASPPCPEADAHCVHCGQAYVCPPPKPDEAAVPGDAVHQAVQHLLTALWLYPHQKLEDRGPMGLLLDALTLLAPEVACALEDGIEACVLIDPDVPLSPPRSSS